MAATLEDFFLEEITEEKLILLLKTYNKPENLDYNLRSHCNFEIWSVNLASREKKIDIFLQKTFLHLIKFCYALFIKCDKVLVEKGEVCKAILKIVIDSLALLGLSTIQINNLRR